jgi:hypothetical protein
MLRGGRRLRKRMRRRSGVVFEIEGKGRNYLLNCSEAFGWNFQLDRISMGFF